MCPLSVSRFCISQRLLGLISVSAPGALLMLSASRCLIRSVPKFRHISSSSHSRPRIVYPSVLQLAVATASLSTSALLMAPLNPNGEAAAELKPRSGAEKVIIIGSGVSAEPGGPAGRRDRCGSDLLTERYLRCWYVARRTYCGNLSRPCSPQPCPLRRVRTRPVDFYVLVRCRADSLSFSQNAGKWSRSGRSAHHHD